MKARKRKLRLLWNAGYRRMIPRRYKLLIVLPPIGFWDEVLGNDERDILGEAESKALEQLMLDEDRRWLETVNKEAHEAV